MKNTTNIYCTSIPAFHAADDLQSTHLGRYGTCILPLPTASHHTPATHLPMYICTSNHRQPSLTQPPVTPPSSYLHTHLPISTHTYANPPPSHRYLFQMRLGYTAGDACMYVHVGVHRARAGDSDKRRRGEVPVGGSWDMTRGCGGTGGARGWWVGGWMWECEGWMGILVW